MFLNPAELLPFYPLYFTPKTSTSLRTLFFWHHGDRRGRQPPAGRAWTRARAETKLLLDFDGRPFAVPDGNLGGFVRGRYGCSGQRGCALHVLQLASIILRKRAPLKTSRDGEANIDTSLLSFFCAVCIAASLGEIASIYPTAGGMSVRNKQGISCLACSNMTGLC